MSFKHFPQEPYHGDPPGGGLCACPAGEGQPASPGGTWWVEETRRMRCAQLRHGLPINGPICQIETSTLKEHELGINR